MMDNAFYGGLLFFAFSAYMLKYALASLRQARESESWPSAQGKILKSEASAIKTTTTWWVEYSYEVEGKSYHGTRGAFFQLVDYEIVHLAEKLKGNRFFSWENIKNSPLSQQVTFAHAPYKVGDTVPVYYNPHNPKQAVLITGRGSKPYGGIWLSCVGMAVGLMCVIIGVLR